MKGNTVKIIGILLILISVGVVIYNVSYAKSRTEQFIENPVETFKKGGENLQERHDFKPPFSVFEIAIVAVGVAGVIALVVPVKG